MNIIAIVVCSLLMQYNYCVCVFVVCDIESKQHKFHDNI